MNPSWPATRGPTSGARSDLAPGTPYAPPRKTSATRPSGRYDLVKSIASDMKANKPEGAPDLSETQMTEMATNIAEGRRTQGLPPARPGRLRLRLGLRRRRRARRGERLLARPGPRPRRRLAARAPALGRRPRLAPRRREHHRRGLRLVGHVRVRLRLGRARGRSLRLIAGGPVAAAARRLDPQPLAGAQRARGLRLDLVSPSRLRPHAPSPPPAAPGGAWRRRSVISE